MQNNYEHIALEWFAKAKSDLDFSKASLRDFDEFYSQMCLLCHDAVEKFLKGYLVSKQKKPKKIHDLMALLQECQDLDESFEPFKEGCRILNRYYTPLKYPSYFPSLTKEDARQSIGIADQICEFVRGRLK